jgi:hypothetical protein
VAVYSGLGLEANAIFAIGGKSKRNEKLATVFTFSFVHFIFHLFSANPEIESSCKVIALRYPVLIQRSVVFQDGRCDVT